MLQNHPAPESRTLPQHITDEHNGLSYTLHGDYCFPDLELPEQQPIGICPKLGHHRSPEG